MMLCKRMAFGLGALVMLTATSSWAVVIGDFEGTNDGWIATEGTAIFPDNTPGYGGFFATNGSSYSANLLAPDLTSSPPSGAFRWSLQLSNSHIPNLAQLFAANPILQADVGWRTDEWSTDADGAWARWDTASINSSHPVGWQQTNDSHMSDTGNPSSPGGWDPTNFGETHKRTIRWNFHQVPALTPAVLAEIAAGTDYFQINISTNYDAAFDAAGGSFWIDNIQLLPIPEPTSLAMVAAIGVLPVIRRRFGRA